MTRKPIVLKAPGRLMLWLAARPEGESNTMIDGRPQPVTSDICTDPDNCKRCKAPPWDKHKHEHAGLRFV